MSDPRKHHYVPCAYLAGFSESNSGQLHVFDRREGRSFCTRPENVGHQRDFYRVDINEVIDDEFVIERKLFQRVDDDGLTALRRFADDTYGSDPQTREMAMAYMAAAYARTPHAREKTSRIIYKMLKSSIGEVFKDDQKFQEFIASLPDEVRNGATFDPEAFRRFALSKEYYEVTLDQNWTVGLPLEAIIPLTMHGLTPRHWVVMLAKDDEHFVTCDNPLTLVSIESVESGLMRFDSPDTIAMFPVDRTRALVGLGRNAVSGCLMPRGVAAVNRSVVCQFHRHVFASKDDFVWEGGSNEIFRSREYLALGEPDPIPLQKTTCPAMPSMANMTSINSKAWIIGD